MSDQEVYLPDERVIPVQDKLYLEYPLFVDWHTDFVTIRHEPPFTGTLPDGTVGTTQWPVLQFMVVSDYPATRVIQRKMGVRHATAATLWERAWEEADREYKHLVGVKVDPLERIFRAIAFKHYDEMQSLASLMN